MSITVIVSSLGGIRAGVVYLNTSAQRSRQKVLVQFELTDFQVMSGDWWMPYH